MPDDDPGWLCAHFRNPVLHDRCSARIQFDEVKIEGRLPCFLDRMDIPCAGRVFSTIAELAEEARASMDLREDVETIELVMRAITRRRMESGLPVGSMKCPICNVGLLQWSWTDRPNLRAVCDSDKCVRIY